MCSVDKAQIGERLAQARAAKGLTQAEIARRIGKTEAAVGHHDNGVRGASAGTPDQYAKAYDVTTDWLITGKGRGPKDAPDPHAEVIDIWDHIEPQSKRQALDVLKAFAKKSS